MCDGFSWSAGDYIISCGATAPHLTLHNFPIIILAGPLTMADAGASSPRFRRLLDKFGAAIKAAFVDKGQLSVEDAFMPGLEDWIEPSSKAHLVIQAAKDVLQSGSSSSSSRSTLPSVSSCLAPALGPPHRRSIDTSVFKRSSFASKAFDVTPICLLDGSSELSARDAERLSVEQWSESIFHFMNDDIKDSFLRGRSGMLAAQHDQLVLESLKRIAQKDQLRSSYYAINRLNTWMEERWSHSHGFKIPDAFMAWFLFQNLVPDGDHVSQSLVTGLRFAEQKLCFPFTVSSASIRALAKGPTKTPKQAPSASLRLVYHFWEIASNTAYSTPLRGISGVFLIMCLCALRGIDAQRSSFEGLHGSGSSFRFFCALAYNSKNRQSMPWACPLVVFGATSDWFGPVREVWGERDFMFAAVARGSSLASASSMLNTMASAYLILRYLREILQLPSVSMSAADAARLRRHSFRHWIANMMRVLKFEWSDRFIGGRWKEQSVMPLRYSMEVQMVSSVELIVRVVTACETVLRDQPLSSWPLFGGWERFLPDRRFSAGEEVSISVEPEGSEASEHSDSSEDEDDGANVRPVAPVSRRALPPGWSRVDRHTDGGRSYACYFGPDGESARSVAEAWRAHHKVWGDQRASFCPPSSCVSLSSVEVGISVSVWWTEDAVFYDGVVSYVDGSLFTIDYDDGETRTHDLECTFVTSYLSVASHDNESLFDADSGDFPYVLVGDASPSGQPAPSFASVAVRCASVEAGQRSRSVSPEAPQRAAPPTPPGMEPQQHFDQANHCGNPRCLVFSVNGSHPGMCRFPVFGHRTRNSSG